MKLARLFIFCLVVFSFNACEDLAEKIENNSEVCQCNTIGVVVIPENECQYCPCLQKCKK